MSVDSNRTLLLLTYYFPPCAGVAVYRSLGLAQHLPAYGWNVEIIAPPSMPWEPDDWDLLKRVPADTKVHRVQHPQSTLWSHVAYRNAQHERWLGPAADMLRTRIEARRPDVVLTTSPPHCIHTLGQMAQREHNLPWVACFRDPWATGVNPLLAATQATSRERRNEATTIAEADLVLANTPQMVKALRTVHPARSEHIELLTNGYDPENYPLPSAGPRGSEVTLLHCGEFYIGRDPRPLFAALRDWNRNAGGDRPRIRLRQVGRISETTFDIEGEIRALGIEQDVEVFGQVPYQDALQAMVDADILVSIQVPGYVHTIPAKIFEYVGAGRPILSLNEPGSDIDWVLAESGVPHRVASPLDRAGIMDSLAHLCKVAMANRAGSVPSSASDTFTRKGMARRLAGMLDTLVNRDGTARRQVTAPGMQRTG